MLHNYIRTNGSMDFVKLKQDMIFVITSMSRECGRNIRVIRDVMSRVMFHSICIMRWVVLRVMGGLTVICVEW